MSKNLRVGSASEPQKWAIVVTPWEDPTHGQLLEIKITEWEEEREAVYLNREGAQKLRDVLDQLLA